jgi:ubiquinone/menaquinone biosynthesis C-methylase UbiE
LSKLKLLQKQSKKYWQIEMSVFQTNYAASYDSLYLAKDYAAECDVIEKLVRPKSQILDIGCGTGGHAGELTKRGHHVTGIDASSAMIEIARAKTRDLEGSPNFHVANATYFDLAEKHFDDAFMMFAVLGYFCSNDDILNSLGQINRHLRMGGVFGGDIWWGPAVLSQRPGERVRVVEQSDKKIIRATQTNLDTLNNVASVNFDLFTFGKSSGVSES